MTIKHTASRDSVRYTWLIMSRWATNSHLLYSNIYSPQITVHGIQAYIYKYPRLHCGLYVHCMYNNIKSN